MVVEHIYNEDGVLLYLNLLAQRAMESLLIIYVCEKCDHEHYFEFGEPRKEHCPFCEVCGATLKGAVSEW